MLFVFSLPRSRACWDRSISSRTRRFRRRRWRRTSTSMGSTTWVQPRTWCSSARTARLSGRCSRPSSRSAGARSAQDTPSGARLFLSAPITSRSPRLGVPALSICEPKEFTGPTAAALMKKQEDYNEQGLPPADRTSTIRRGTFSRRGRRSEGAGAAGVADCRRARDAEVQRRRPVRERAEVEVTKAEGRRQKTGALESWNWSH